MYIFSAPPFLFQAPEVLCAHERAEGKKSVENGAQPPDSTTAREQKKDSCRRAGAPLIQTPEVLCRQDPSGRKRRAENAAQPSERRSALEQKNDSDRRASARRGVPALAVLRDLPLKSQNCQCGRRGWARGLTPTTPAPTPTPTTPAASTATTSPRAQQNACTGH